MASAERLIVFAPGAGASSSSQWMQAWKQRLLELGRVETFDYPYQREGRRRPDPLPALVRAHGEAVDQHFQSERSLVLAGKSMGSRVGCHLSLERPVSALVCFGYPLVA